jgi:hypothetical protein
MGAVAIFFVAVVVWRSIYVEHGNIGFWQLAADQPDIAYQWMKGRPDWILLHPQDPRVEQLKQSPNLVGPFRLAAPSAGGMVVMFAESESIDASQREFIALHGGSREKGSFPWLSWLAMLYPIVAMLWIASHGAPLLATLGYGLAILGYILFGAGVLTGSFRALGFRYRIPRFIAAVVVWVTGTVLSNL